MHQCVFFLIVIAIAIVLGISLRDVTRARFELIAVKCDVRQWRNHGGGDRKGKCPNFSLAKSRELWKSDEKIWVVGEGFRSDQTSLLVRQNEPK